MSKQADSVCHKWASRQVESAKRGNVSFRRDTIYSYGWWPMAQWHTGVNGEEYIIMPGWSYSNSTSKHLHSVNRAIPKHVKVFHSNERETSYSSYRQYPDLSPKAALKTLLLQITNFYNDFFNVRNYVSERSATPAERQEVSKAIYNDAVGLCELAGLEWDQDFDVYLVSDTEVRQMEVILKPYRARLEERIRIRKEKEAAIDAAYTAALKKYLINPVEAAKMWMRKEISSHSRSIELPENDEYRLLTGKTSIYQEYATAMRIEGDRVVTNRHAEVPVREAKILWEAMKSGRNIHGAKVGHYTVVSWNGELVIGCHHIPREIVEYFVELYNW